MKKVEWTKELLNEIVPKCTSYSEVLRKIGLKPLGSNPKTLKKKLDEFNIDYSHFTGQGWNKYGHPKFGNSGKPLSAVLDVNSSLSTANVRKRLLNNKIKSNVCEICGISEWNGFPIVCELHHINGDSTDNRIENLQMLCPNCHSQTDNYCGKNIKKMV